MASTAVPVFAPDLVEDNDDTSFSIYIAIDFGTDGVGKSAIICVICIVMVTMRLIYIGLAYAFQEDIYIHSKWNSTRYGATVKPKTIILLDDKGKIISFGMDAKITLILSSYPLSMTKIKINKQCKQLYDIGVIQKG